MNEQTDHWLSRILLALLGAILATTLTTSCASSLEITEEHLKAGRVDDALMLIEKVRQAEAENPEAKSIESKVRRQWISDKLIQVRLLRLGGNLESSASLFRTVIQKETSWAMMPSGAVFATQAEESSHLAASVQSAIRQALQKGLPILAVSIFLRDRDLLENTLKVDTRPVRIAIGDAMARFCAKESGALTKYDHFHYQFLQKTCGHFKVTIPKMETQSSVRLFSRLHPKFDVKGVPESSIADIGEDLTKEFEKSIWFTRDADSSRELEFVLSGAVIETVDERPVYRSKPFSVQIPFEERSVRKKEVKSGIGLLFEVLAWALGAGLPSSREEDNFDGTVTVYETKYRTETRYHTYQVKEITQTLKLDWKVEMNFRALPSHEARHLASATSNSKPTSPRIALGRPDGVTAGKFFGPFSFEDKYRLVSDEHSVRFPDANLFPETRKTLHPIEWLKTVNRKLLDRVGAEFNSAWIGKFCDFQKEPLLMSEAELHHRCAFGAIHQLPESSSGWFTKRYGVEIEAWRQVLAVSL